MTGFQVPGHFFEISGEMHQERRFLDHKSSSLMLILICRICVSEQVLTQTSPYQQVSQYRPSAFTAERTHGNTSVSPVPRSFKYA